MVLSILVWISLAFGGDIPEGLRPVLAPGNAPAQFEKWQTSEGKNDVLACESIWGEDALLCFRVWEGKRRRWVTAKDLKQWNTTSSQLKAYLKGKATEYLTDLELKKPVDLPGEYYELAHGDGWAAAALLRPDLVCDQLGVTHLLMVAPNESFVLTWRPGKAELDSAIGIAAKAAFEDKNGPVSPVVYYWKGGVWTPYGEAKPRKP